MLRRWLRPAGALVPLPAVLSAGVRSLTRARMDLIDLGG